MPFLPCKLTAPTISFPVQTLLSIKVKDKVSTEQEIICFFIKKSERKDVYVKPYASSVVIWGQQGQGQGHKAAKFEAVWKLMS